MKTDLFRKLHHSFLILIVGTTGEIRSSRMSGPTDRVEANHVPRTSRTLTTAVAANRRAAEVIPIARDGSLQFRRRTTRQHCVGRDHVEEKRHNQEITKDYREEGKQKEKSKSRWYDPEP